MLPSTVRHLLIITLVRLKSNTNDNSWNSVSVTTASCIAEISPLGYTFYHRPRLIGRGGGIGFLVSDHFKVKLHSNPDYSSFESMCAEISDSSFSAFLFCIYRPPGHPANFFEDFQDLLENVAINYSELYILGDFNLHLDIHSSVTTMFDDILTSFDLKQHVNFSTHIHGHWLDLIITHSGCNNIKKTTVSDGLSDHHTVIVDINMFTTPLILKKKNSYRPIHKIDITAFNDDILNSDLSISPAVHECDIYRQCCDVLKTLLDKHAPLAYKYISKQSPSPWMTSEI